MRYRLHLKVLTETLAKDPLQAQLPSFVKRVILLEVQSGCPNIPGPRALQASLTSQNLKPITLNLEALRASLPLS